MAETKSLEFDDGLTVDEPIATSASYSYITLTEQAAPATPASGKLSVYATTGGGLAYINDDGYEITIPASVKVTDALGWDGVAVSVVYDVSGLVTDARNAIWTLKNSVYKQIQGVDISSSSATNVTVAVGIPLPADTYYLIGIG